MDGRQPIEVELGDDGELKVSVNLRCDFVFPHTHLMRLDVAKMVAERFASVMPVRADAVEQAVREKMAAAAE